MLQECPYHVIACSEDIRQAQPRSGASQVEGHLLSSSMGRSGRWSMGRSGRWSGELSSKSSNVMTARCTLQRQPDLVASLVLGWFKGLQQCQHPPCCIRTSSCPERPSAIPEGWLPLACPPSLAADTLRRLAENVPLLNIWQPAVQGDFSTVQKTMNLAQNPFKSMGRQLECTGWHMRMLVLASQKRNSLSAA